jgi:hypothetical protein
LCCAVSTGERRCGRQFLADQGVVDGSGEGLGGLERAVLAQPDAVERGADEEFSHSAAACDVVEQVDPGWGGLWGVHHGEAAQRV